MSKKNCSMLVRLLRSGVALLLCSLLMMQNDVLISRAYAEGDTPHPDANRLSGCEDVASGKTDSAGDRCTIRTANYDNQDIIVTEGYYSVLVLWVVALVAIVQLKQCMKGNHCGYATLFSSIAGLALLAGEIVQIAMYSDAQDKIEYRPDMLRKYKDQCAGSGSGSGGEVGSDVGTISDANGGNTRSICDQYSALVAQKKSYEKSKQAAEIKMDLQIAAAVAYGLAAAIEYYGAIAAHLAASAMHDQADVQVGALPAAVTACSAEGGPAAAAKAAQCAPQCAPCMAAVGTAVAALTNEITQLSNPAPMSSRGQREAILAPLEAADTALAACNAAGAECTASASSFVAAFKAHVQLLKCPQMSNCTPGDYPTPVPGADAFASFFVQRPYQYAWQNFYFRPAGDNLLSGLDDEQMASTQMEKMEKAAILNGESQSPHLTEYQYLQYLDGLDLFTQNQESFFLKALGQLIPSAQAGTSAANVSEIITKGIGLTSAAVIIIVSLLFTTNQLAELLFGTPIKRAAWNTLTATLAAGGAIYTKYGVIDKLDENIKKIQSILDSANLNPNKIKIQTSSVIPYNEVSLDIESLKGRPIISKDNPPLPCANGGDGKGGCKDVSNDLASSLQSLNLGSLAGLTKSISTLGKELGGSRDVSPKAMNAATKLAANAVKAQKFLKDAKLLYNQTRGKANLPPVPFEKVERDMMKNLFAKAHATLKAHNTDAAALLGGVKPSNQVSEQEKKNFAEKVKAFQASQTAAGTTSTAAAADPFAAFELQNQDGANANGEINSGKEGEVAIDSALNIRTNDIQNDPSVSIFEMLTARYLKSYPVLFDEEKAAPSK